MYVQLSVWSHIGGSWFRAKILKPSGCGSVSARTVQTDGGEGAGWPLG